MGAVLSICPAVALFSNLNVHGFGSAAIEYCAARMMADLALFTAISIQLKLRRTIATDAGIIVVFLIIV